ncbi:hypothetical protein THTE_3419 [Thermogutta terrifontis]|uniref:Uncharacterized protein n=1 Tax=Thermogutta terrifontis TaxID=1331910 RepID=A0A286RJ79_9BACT|nr:hypothetical protein THTE_3419 [Thermogutta terrifontis]
MTHSSGDLPIRHGGLYFKELPRQELKTVSASQPLSAVDYPRCDVLSVAARIIGIIIG